MERSEIDARLKKMLIEHLGVSDGDVQPGTRLVPALADGSAAVGEKMRVGTSRRTFVDASIPNLGADSLDVVELVMAAEEEFDIVIPDDEADPLNEATVEGLGDFIAGKLAP